MKKAKIHPDPEFRTDSAREPSWTASDLTSRLYVHDPDFRRHQPLGSPSGPGTALTGQEREVVRRLLYRLRIQKSASPESLVHSLPKGVELSNDQLEIYMRAGNRLISGMQDDLTALILQDYRTEPVSISQFIDDPYYLGASLHRTDTNEGLWPWWREWLSENADLGSFLHTLVISGAIGVGKSLAMVTLLLYRTYLCTALRDPYSFFGLSRGSPIDILLLSLSVDTMRATVWQWALRLMQHSRFFQSLCGGDPSRTQSGPQVVLRVNTDTPEEIQITFSGGSKHQHQIGRNVLCVGLDEGNFRLEKDPQAYAFELFDDLRTRIASRFRRIGRFDPGLSVVASSAGAETCFTEQLIRQIEEDGDPKGQMVVRPAHYRVKPGGLRLRSWWFLVAYGLPNVEPAIMRGCYSDSELAISTPSDCPPEIAGTHEAIPQGAQCELVPGDYFDDFVRSPRRCLQQISGISLGGSNKLFPTLVDINRCLELSAQEGVPVPTQATIIQLSDENERQIWEDLDHKTFVRHVGTNSYQPVRHSTRLRYVHIDLAVTGFAGVAICHLSDPFSSQQGSEHSENLRPKLIVEYDFILTLAPGKRRPICFDKIVKFILWLRDICGFRIGLVTADSFQSEHMLQTFYARGIKTNRQSVDRDKHAYFAWRAAFQESCIRLYPQKQLLKEASGLIELESKIDHSPNGGKDATDAAAGAYLNAISSDEVLTVCTPQAPPVVLGISQRANASPEDPFGFFVGLTRKRSVKTFHV